MPLNILMLISGKTKRQLSEECGILEPQFIVQEQNNRFSSETIKKLEEIFFQYKDKKTFLPKFPVVETVRFFIIYEDSSKFKIESFFTCKERNSGKLFDVSVISRDGVFASLEKEVIYKDFLDGKHQELEEVSKKEIITVSKKINKSIFKFFQKCI